MYKFYSITILLVFLIRNPLLVGADEESISKVAPLLEKVTRYHKNHNKIAGNFVLKINNSTQEGSFYFYNDDENGSSVKLLFGDEKEDSQSIVEKFSYWIFHNQHLWIYLANRHVLVDQTVPKYFLSIGNLGNGLTHYFLNYKNFSITEKKEKNLGIMAITFSNPVKPVAFDQVTIEITADGFQRATYATSKNKNTVTKFAFILDNVNENPDFNENKIFKVNPSGNVQILRNVLIKNK
jgi:hypothetical protein